MIPKKPVKIACQKQNVYIIPQSNHTPIKLLTEKEYAEVQEKQRIKSYVSLEKKNLPNGSIEELVEKDYPINVESVSSYIESSDYRNDPAQAVQNSPKRLNLGDVTEMQEFIKNDPINAINKYKGILQAVEQYFQNQQMEVKKDE